MRGAVIGYGFISGKGHVPAYLQREDVQIVAVADICPARRERAASEIPGVRVYEDGADLIAKEAELDFVDISTPPHMHAELAILAMERGLHVLCEKPLATSTKEAQAMLLAAQKNNRVLFPCHNYKHAPVVKTIKGIIDRGTIGQVRSLTLQTFRYTHAKGVEEWNTDWRRELRYSGGGIAMDHGSHTFYLTFSWLNDLPDFVGATATNLDPRWDTEDTLHCVLKFPNGMVNSFLSWTAGARKMIYTVEGTEGAIFVNNDDLEVVCREKTVEKFTIASDWMDASHTKWFNSMFDLFQKAIAEDDYVNAEVKESYLCVQIIEQAYASNREDSRLMPIAKDFSFLGQAASPGEAAVRGKEAEL